MEKKRFLSEGVTWKSMTPIDSLIIALYMGDFKNLVYYGEKSAKELSFNYHMRDKNLRNFYGRRNF